jgi:CHAT domain-containing protein/tetratricopeptide (TPR) repeat protein
MHRRMLWLTGFLCVAAALIEVAYAADKPPEAVPPRPPYQRLLRGEDARKAEELRAQLNQAWAAGHFEESLRTAESILALRTKAQGADHWQTVDARWQAEAVRRILKQDAATRQEMAAVPALARRAREQESAAHHRQAQSALEKILALRRKVLGDDHPDTAAAYNDLAYNLDAQGRYAAAQPLFGKALAILRKALGEDHPKTAVGYSNAARNLHAQGRYAAAQPLFEKALAILRKALGEEHPATARIYSNLAASLNARGRYAAAQPLYEKALAICRNALGENHPGTALSYNNVAYTLSAQGRYAAAQPLLEKALAIYTKVLGEDHPDTAQEYNNVAGNLSAQGRYAAAQPLYEKALAIWRKVLGEEHPYTAQGYNNVAGNLSEQGKYAAAQPLFEKALAIYRKALGEEHPDTARGYNNVAGNLNDQGRYAAAQPLFEKALAIFRMGQGEDHPETARSYNSVAANLNDQGRYAAAQPLFEKALAIRCMVLGEDHPETARSYNSVAANLHAQGRYAAAQRLYEKALAIYIKGLGEDHPDTARGYNDAAVNLNAQGRYAAAQRLYEKALAINRKSLGEDHPHTAISYHNVAANLKAQGRYAAAQRLYEKALAINRKSLGEDHPDTARSCDGVAVNLHAQGRYAQAETYLSRGAEGFARAWLLLASAGLERAAVTGERSPLPLLAAVLARNGKPEAAWRRFEESLARGTWDDLSARLRRSPAERDRQTALGQQLRRLDQLIQGTFTTKGTPEVKARREDLLTQRRTKGDELAALTEQLEKEYGPAAGQVYDRTTIQKALAPDAALIAWIDIPGQPTAADPNGEHWAVVLRATGVPVWRRLRGIGKDGAWTDADTRLPGDLRRALLDPSRDWQTPADRLRAQRIQPLAQHLAPGHGLPAVRRLIVLPSPALAGLPLEVCAPEYTVGYAPSGTIFTYLHGLPPAAGRGLLALADPVFDAARHKPGRTPLPPGGLLVTLVVPNGNAARARLRADDVLLRYAGGELKQPADLGRLIQQHAQDREVPLTVWRAGQNAERTVAGGPLGVVVARQPAPQALTERHQNDELLARSRGTADDNWPELPGTRAEAAGLRRVCAAAGLRFRLLADSDASEQQLDRLARSKGPAGYRYLHLATHGDLNDKLPLQSAVILSRDHLPDPRKQLEAGQPVYDGRLTAEKILERWDLHAELVTLSACETALGKYEDGEGFVGFTQALLLSGARSVCLSLWKVDDTATALVMQRFYANLLGQRDGVNKPLGKAEALAEAKEWLRGLSMEDAARQAATLTEGVARGKGRKALPALPVAKGPSTGQSAKPYAHPYYWAAFVLVGDAD